MGEETVESILEFLNDGTSRIKPSPSRNIILVLGESGTGKSTLTQFLATDGEKLIAKKVSGNVGYTITDQSKAICGSTVISCTAIPELVVDHKGNATYYDCPGFHDTRTVSHDIGASYFVRKVINQAGAVKIIFTVDYTSVEKGGSRHGFTKLVENVFTMFTNIGKYERSVCLVVNKVPTVPYQDDDGQWRIVSNDDMIQGIVEFLKETRDDLSEELETENPPDKVRLYKNTIKMINIFINEKDPKHPRVGIFRKPFKPGPLGEMKEFQAGKAALQEMIYDKLIYTTCNKTDFRYTVSDGSKLRLNDIRKLVVESLLDDVSSLVQRLVDHYKEREKESADIDDLLNELTLGRDKAVHVKRELSKENISLKGFTQGIISCLNELNFIVSVEKRQELWKYSEHLEFIEAVINDSTSSFKGNWQNSLEKVLNYFDQSINWYSFLTDLRVTLSEYNIQFKVHDYSTLLDRLRVDSGETNQEQFINNIKEFLLKINTDSGRNYEIPNVEGIDKIKSRFLQELLDVGFKPMTAECKEEKLEVKGWHVKMSDVLESMQHCFTNTTNATNSLVEIFALNKIFVDEDFTKKGGQLVMIAPELEVINNRGINLNGEDAQEHVERKATTTSTVPGSGGVSGLPGLPGGPGGELITVIQTCKNCNSLTVTAIGGRGGSGQDGGDGVPGEDGGRATIPTVYGMLTKEKLIESWRYDGLNPECESPRQRRGLGLFLALLGVAAAASAATAAANASRKIKCVVRGVTGERGGNGGGGGIGGDGGNAGRVSILYENSVPTNEGPNILVSRGLQGAPGEGGDGGRGGRNGDTLHMVLKVYSINGETKIEEQYYGTSYGTSYGPHGIPGEADMNEDGFIQPTSINPIDLPRSLDSFKEYVQKMGNSIVSSTMKNFLEYFKIHEKSKRSVYALKSLTSTVSNGGQSSPNSGISLEKTSSENSNFTAQSIPALEEVRGNSTAGLPVNFDLMNVQSNLLLMDVLIRKFKGQTSTRSQGMGIDDSQAEYAHVLAYNAYVPENRRVSNKHRSIR